MTETKSGYIEQSVAGKKKGKFMWFSLYGSSLFSYTDPTSIQAKSTFQLKDSTITNEGLTITGKRDGEEVVCLTATSQDEFDSWFGALTACTSLEAESAPTKEKKKKDKGSMSMRVGKAVGGKVATSGVGKAVMKNAVNEETKLLIVSLKRIIAKVETPKIAVEIEDNLVKIITKAFCLEKDKKITMDEFLQADAPLREAFETLVEMRDYRHRMKPGTVKARLEKVHERLTLVEKVITDMLVAHLKPKSIQRVARTFGLLASASFLDRAWGDAEVEDERDLLTDAMNKYTQFHF